LSRTPETRPTKSTAPTAVLISVKEATQWLKRYVSTERLAHSLGTHDKAVELAEKFKLTAAEQYQASIGSLLHDVAKLLSPDELYAYCERHQINLHPEDRMTPQTVHPFVGAHLVETELQIVDAEILNAIRFHTTARPDMSSVEKIVYIADKIEGNTRNPLFIQKVTAHLDPARPESLDETMLYLLDSTLSFILEKGQWIHSRTLEARNFYLKKPDSGHCSYQRHRSNHHE
jgi:predicted HD superfamily hydrolase involved in NAD metabolism